MQKYTKRLEVRVLPRHLEHLRAEARKRKIPVGEIVREAIDQKYAVSREAKIKEAQKMFSLDLPVKDWKAMKKEIAEGYKE